MIRVFTGDPDGSSLGSGPLDAITLYNSGPVQQRSNPSQGPLSLSAGAQVVTYQQTLTPASIVTVTAAEQSLTVGTTAGNGPLTTDFVAAVNKPTAQAGIGIHTARISAANTLQVVFSNTSTGTLTPTASQVYNVTLLRNFPVHSQTLTPAAVPAATTSEQIFTLAPTTAVGTARINAAGQVTGVVVTTAGANYTTSPIIVFNYGVTTPQVNPANSTTAALGMGASAIPILSGGTVVGVEITNPGTGYAVAPTVTFLGGNNIAPGMAVMVTKPTTNAGLALSNVRVTGINQIGITYVNPTAAAVTPTSEAYSIMGLHTLPADSQVVSYGMVATGLVSVASITTAEQTFTVSGLVATDIVISANKPTLSAGISPCNARVSAANTVAITFVNASAAAVTPSATEIYFVTCLTQTPTAPFAVLTSLLSPTSVAANTTAEQTFTVTGLTFTNSSPATVFVNKPSFQAGLAIAGCRISASNTLAITFENVTATAIVPTAEVYTIGAFGHPGPSGGVPGSWVAVTSTRMSTRNLINEMQQVLSESGLGAMKGA